MTLTPEVLRRRVFNAAVNSKLRTNTILRELSPFLSEHEIAIDVGAATGHITCYLADHAKEVYSFEAVPVVFERLQEMELQYINVRAFNVAISDFNGFDNIYVDHKRLSNSSFLDLVGGPKYRVHVASLDSLFITDKTTGPVGFIKIDTEGTELDVLHGAQDVIAHWHPTVMVEIYEPYSKYPLEEVFEFFFERGYECFCFSPESGLYPISDTMEGVAAVKERHAEHDGDFLFTWPTLHTDGKQPQD